MKKILKRTISVILAIIMIVQLLPFQAFAQDGNAKGENVGLDNPGVQDLIENIENQNLRNDEINNEASNEEINEVYNSNASLQNWETFEYGIYPQDLVSDSAVVEKLSNVTPNSKGVYVLNGEKYAKSGGKYYIFKPIIWRVLRQYDKNSVLIVSENVLDSQVYNVNSSNLSWEKSTIRSWLNLDFYNLAFSVGERTCIHKTEIDNSKKSNPFGYSSNNTIDKIFLLSYADLINTENGFNSDPRYDDNKRCSKSTAYAQSKGAGSDYCNYWTRSSSSSSVQYVLSSDGCVGSCHSPVSADSSGYGVRPAIVVDKSSTYYKSVKPYGGSIVFSFYDKTKTDNDSKGFNILDNVDVTIEAGTKKETIKTNDKGIIEYELPKACQKISFSVSGYEKYTMYTDVIQSVNFAINLSVSQRKGIPYISTVYCKSGNKWHDATLTEVKFDKENKSPCMVYVCPEWEGKKAGTITIAQNGRFLSNSTGIFTSKEMLEKGFVPGKKIYVYCKSEDNIGSKAVETKIQLILSDSFENMFSGGKYSILGKDGLKYTIPDSIDIIGGMEVGLDLPSFPVGLSYEDGKILVSLGLNLFPSGDEKEKEDYSYYKSILKQFNMIENYKDENKKIKDAKTYYNRLNGLRKAKKQKRITGKLFGKGSVDVEFFGYLEFTILDDGTPSLTEGYASLMFTGSYEMTRQYLVGWFPVYCQIEVGLKAQASGSATRPAGDKNMPFEWNIDILITPFFGIEVGAGVPKCLSLGVNGKGELPILWKILDQYLKIDLTTTLSIKAKAFMFSFSKKIKSKTINIAETNYGKNKSNSTNLNANKYGEEPSEFEEFVNEGVYEENNYVETLDRVDTRWADEYAHVYNSESPTNEPEVKFIEYDSYEDPSVSLISVNGKKVLVWIQDNSNRSSYNRTELVYSIYDDSKKSWTTPAPVDANSDTADFYPSAVAIGNDIYIVWHDIKTTFEDDADISLEDFSKNSEIKIAKLDVNSNSIIKVASITNNSVLDTFPTVVKASDNSAYVVWERNHANNYFGTEGQNDICYITVSSDLAFGAEKKIDTAVPAIQNIAATAENGKLFVSCSYDNDSDFSNMNDTEIVQYKVDSGKVLKSTVTNNSVIDSNPKYAFVDGKLLLIWNSNGEFKSIDALNNTSETSLFADGFICADMYDVCTDSNKNAYLIWSQVIGQKVEIYSSTYSDGNWQKPVQITNAGSKYINPKAVCNSDGSMFIVSQHINQEKKTDNISGYDFEYYVDKETNLVTIHCNPYTKLEIDDGELFVDESEIEPSKDVLLPIVVKNNGTTSSSGYIIKINGEEVYESNNTIESGESERIEVPYKYPEEIEKNTTLNIEMIPKDDIFVESNPYELEYGFENLTIAESEVQSENECHNIFVTIVNESNIDSDDYVIRLLDDRTNEEITAFDGTGIEGQFYDVCSFVVDDQELNFDDNGIATIRLSLFNSNDEEISYEIIAIEKYVPSGTSAELIDLVETESSIDAHVVLNNDTNEATQGYVKVHGFDSDGNNVYESKKYIDVESNTIIDLMYSIEKSYNVKNVEVEFEDTGRIFEYYLNEEKTEVTIDNYLGNVKNLTIPETINDIPVVAIADNSFANHSEIESLVIPNSIRRIGYSAFRNDKNISEINIPKSVEQIENLCFAGCSGIKKISVDNENESYKSKDNVLYDISGETLILATNGAESTLSLEGVKVICNQAFAGNNVVKNIDFGSQLEIIEDYAFKDCSKLESVILPDTVESVGNYAFISCDSLRSFDSGNGLTILEAGLLSGCAELTTLTIGENVEMFGNKVLDGCNSLSKIYYNSQHAADVANGVYVFSNCGSSSGIEVVFNEDVERIPNNLFRENKKIKSIDFSNANLVIGQLAFYKNSNLTTLKNNSNVKSISRYAFNGCNKLVDMDSWDVVTKIGEYAFYNCTSLETFSLSSKLKNIEQYAFYNCSALKSINLEFVEKIEAYTFYGCASLEDVISLENLSTIGAYAFQNCSKLSKVDLGSLDSVAPYAFSNCSKLNVTNWSKKIKFIGNGAFNYCSGLSNIYLPNTIEEVEDNAFSSCYSVRDVYMDCPNAVIGSSVFSGVGNNYRANLVFGDSYKSINDYLFYNQGISLNNVELGKNVTSVGKYAFYGSGIRTMSNTDRITFIGDYAFYNTPILNFKFGNDIKTIGRYAFYNCTSLKEAIIPDSIEIIYDYAFYGAGNITNLTIGSSVKTINQYAFYGCSKLQNVIIPESVGRIEKYAFANCTGLLTVDIMKKDANVDSTAFYGCSSLTSFGENTDRIIENGIVYSSDKSELFTVLKSYSGKLNVPNTVEIIHDSAFYKCSSITEINIPDSVEIIEDNAFYDCNNVKTINIGSGVSYIGANAFYGCQYLETLNIKSDLINIGDYAFYNCSRLTALTIPQTVKSIGNYAFCGCTALTEISIPNSVKKIGNYAFYNCTKATSINLGNNLKTIGNYAFYGACLIKTLNIPDSVETIGDYAFYDCRAITELTIGESLKSVGSNAFYYLYNLQKLNYNAIRMNDFTNDSSTRIFYDTGKNSGGFELVVGEKVEKIPNYLMYINDTSYPNKVTSINILAEDIEIGICAFSYCTSLRTVTSKSIKVIDRSAFYNCTSLTNIDLSKVTESINNYAFRYCTSLTSANIGDSVKTIGSYAFEGCTSITNVNIGNSVETMGTNAFYDCRAITELTIGESVKSVGSYAFYNLYNLQKLNYNAIRMNDFTNDSSTRIFYNTGRDSGGFELVVGEKVEKIPNYLMYPYSTSYPNKVTSINILAEDIEIGICAFSYCTSLRTVTSKSIKIIDRSAFYNCTSLANIDLSKVTESINNYAFEGCTSIINVNIGNAVETIGTNAFYNCRAITELTIGESVKSVGSNAFYNLYNLQKLNYNAIRMNDFTNDSSTRIFYNTGRDSGGFELVVGEKVEKIPNYLMYPYSTSYPNKVTSINILAEDIEIGICAFSYCTSLRTVTSKSMKVIDISAFYNCTSLANIDLSKVTESINNYAFEGCTSITNVNIGNAVETIGTNAFYNCRAITELTIGESVKSVGSNAFYNLYNLQKLNYNAIRMNDFTNDSSTRIFYNTGRDSGGFELVVGEKVEKIPNYLMYTNNTSYPNKVTSINILAENIEIGICAFYYCTSLRTVTSKSIKIIDQSAFNNCTSLTNIDLSKVTQAINYKAFYNCTSLTSANIGNAVETIGAYAFYDCRAITELTIGESVKSVGSNAFYNLYNLQKLNYNAINANDLSNYIFYRAGYNSGGFVVNIGNNVERIPNNLLACESTSSSYINKAKKVICGKQLKSIGDYAFSYCRNLTQVILNKSLESIGTCAFYYCNLSSVTIPSSVKTINSNAFYSASKPSISGYSGTAANNYAINNNYTWIQIDDSKEITSISFSNTLNETVYVGRNYYLNEITVPQFYTDELNWTSDNTAVATVDSNGCVTGVSKGSATITVTTKNGLSASYTINVASLIDISSAVIICDDQVYYTGNELTPNVQVVLNGISVPSAYYDVSYSSNVDLGTATIVVAGKNKFTGVISRTFEIVCSHSDATTNEETEPTCTENGLLIKNCEYCGETLEEIVPATGHTLGAWEQVIDPTYVSEGETVRKCTVCQEIIETKVVSKLVEHIAPTVQIKIDETVFSQFLNTITFNLYQKEYFDVEITAEDNDSGIKEILYYVSDKALSYNEVSQITEWNTYTSPFRITNGVVYSLVRDNSNNTTIISSNGYKFDVDPPSFEGIDEGGLFCTNASFKIIDANLNKVLIDGVETTVSQNYYVTSCGNHTVEAVDSVGNSSTVNFTVIGSHKAGEWIVDSVATPEKPGVKHIECELCGECISKENIIYTDEYEISSCTVTINDSRFEYTGSPIIPEITVVDINGQELVKDIDYSVELKNNINIGCANLIVIGCGDYRGSQSINFNIVCLHNYVHNYVNPTCYMDGYNEYICQYCGDYYTEINESSKLPHSYIIVQTKESCLGDGYIVYQCESCKNSYSESIPAIEHVVEIDEAVAATCLSTGLTKGSHCSICATTIVKQEVIDKLDHVYVPVVVEPTCSTRGYTVYTCKDCGNSYISEYVDKTSHIEGSAVIENVVNPTCFASGCYDEVIYCSECNKELRRKSVVVEKTEHEYVVDKEAISPKCTTDGYTEKKVCSICNKTIGGEIVPAIGHDYEKSVINPTCSSRGYTVYHCVRCDNEYVGDYVDATNHEFTNYISNGDATCTKNGTETATCNKCDKTRTRVCANSKLEHTVVYDSEVKATCKTTGLTRGSHCSVCGVTIVEQKVIPKTEHSLVTTTTKATTSKNGTITTKCSECGLVSSTKTIYKINTVSLSKTKYVYDGNNKKPSVTVLDSNGNKISSSYYTVTYSNNTAVGKATVKVVFKTKYNATVTRTFTIVPKSTSIVSLTPVSKGFSVKWNKQTTQTTGYEIQYATNSGFTSNAKTVSITKNTAFSKTVSNLAVKKKYYVRVRTFKTVNGTKYYSDWSKSRYVVTK